MAYRKFKDVNGDGWEVRPESRNRWWLHPLPGNDGTRRAANPPGYTDDPFELSEQELHKLLDASRPSGSRARAPSPFEDL